MPLYYSDAGREISRNYYHLSIVMAKVLLATVIFCMNIGCISQMSVSNMVCLDVKKIASPTMCCERVKEGRT